MLNAVKSEIAQSEIRNFSLPANRLISPFPETAIHEILVHGRRCSCLTKVANDPARESGSRAAGRPGGRTTAPSIAPDRSGRATTGGANRRSGCSRGEGSIVSFGIGVHRCLLPALLDGSIGCALAG